MLSFFLVVMLFLVCVVFVYCLFVSVIDVACCCVLFRVEVCLALFVVGP